MRISRGLVAGYGSLVMENPAVRVVILPELGGRVWELWDLERGRQWIWHREGVPPCVAGPGSSYDEVWAGGWEELFPNDAPGEFEGRRLPDHGEWWTLGWEVAEAHSGPDGGVVCLRAETTAVRAVCTKELHLSATAQELRVSYRIESREASSFHFLFKQHLAVAVSDSCSLALPGGTITAVSPGFGTLLPGPGPYEWPFAGGEDLRRISPRSSGARDFVYVTELPEPWCGVDDASSGASLRLHHDPDGFPHTWLFLSYGGWRDCYTAVLEPCSNMPKDLAEAVRAGGSAVLPPGGVFETSVRAVLGATG